MFCFVNCVFVWKIIVSGGDLWGTATIFLEHVWCKFIWCDQTGHFPRMRSHACWNPRWRSSQANPVEQSHFPKWLDKGSTCCLEDSWQSPRHTYPQYPWESARDRNRLGESVGSFKFAKLISTEFRNRTHIFWCGILFTIHFFFLLFFFLLLDKDIKTKKNFNMVLISSFISQLLINFHLGLQVH